MHFKIIKEQNLDKLFIKYISGPTSLRHLNRFSNSIAEFKSISAEIADHDMKFYGDDCILCDISFLFDGNSFNVMNRTSFYSYYIDIMCGNEQNKYRIPLNDLFLKITNGQLIIFSKELQKRIIPLIQHHSILI